MIETRKIESQYSIFKTGGKQYQAVVGETLAVEKIEGEAGKEVVFNEVLFVKNGEGDYVLGNPFVKGATVKSTIVKQTKGPKLIVFKFKRRKKYRLKKGHRQPLTVVRFVTIS